MKKAEKINFSKTEVINALGFGDEKRKKNETSDSGYLINKSHFDNDGTQNYLVFHPVYNHFKMPSNSYVVIA